MRYDMKEMFQQKSFLVSPEPAGAKKKFFSVARTRWSEKKVFWRCPNPLEQKKVFLSNRYMKTSLFYFVFNVAPTVFSQIVQHLAQYPF